MTDHKPKRRRFMATITTTHVFDVLLQKGQTREDVLAALEDGADIDGDPKVHAIRLDNGEGLTVSTDTVLALEEGDLVNADDVPWAREALGRGTEPPESAWFEIGGRRWASNGVLMLRDDAPRPEGLNDWLPSEGFAEEERRASAASLTVPGTVEGRLSGLVKRDLIGLQAIEVAASRKHRATREWVSARFESLLTFGDALAFTEQELQFGDTTRTHHYVQVLLEGEVVAVLAPLRVDE